MFYHIGILTILSWIWFPSSAVCTHGRVMPGDYIGIPGYYGVFTRDIDRIGQTTEYDINSTVVLR